MKRVFKFDIGGNLKAMEMFSESAANSDSQFDALRYAMPKLDMPWLQEQMDSINNIFEQACGVPKTAFVDEDMYRTIKGYGQHLDQALVNTQKMENGIRNSIMDMMKIVIDPYMPKTVRRQFRFPRSKKVRIQKKWRKDQRNWRDEKVIYFMGQRPLWSEITYPNGTTRLYPIRDNFRSCGAIHNFS